MKKRTYQFLISYLISIIIDIAIIVFEIKQLDYRNPFNENWMIILSDASFVNAVIFGGVWGLSWISNDGLFDIFAYSFKRFGARMFRKNPKYTNVPKTFYDYRVLKHDDEPAYINYLGWVALTHLVIAIIFVITNTL